MRYSTGVSLTQTRGVAGGYVTQPIFEGDIIGQGKQWLSSSALKSMACLGGAAADGIGQRVVESGHFSTVSGFSCNDSPLALIKAEWWWLGWSWLKCTNIRLSLSGHQISS